MKCRGQHPAALNGQLIMMLEGNGIESCGTGEFRQGVACSLMVRRPIHGAGGFIR